jgi:hypothetical protein
VVNIAHRHHLNGVEVLAKLNVAVGVPAPHTTTTYERDLEGH